MVHDEIVKMKDEMPDQESCGCGSGHKFDSKYIDTIFNEWSEKHFEILNLDNMLSHDIHYLPCNFYSLAEFLEELYLSNNNLRAIPESIISFTKLRRLIVEHNQIEVIPNAISEFKELREFRAGHNRLKALPDASGMFINLEILTLNNNEINKLPDWIGLLSKLWEFDVSFNNLESIPQAVCGFRSLVKMNIGHNRLRFLPFPSDDDLGAQEVVSNMRKSPSNQQCLPRLKASWAKVWKFMSNRN